MGKFIDYTGRKFGSLVAIKPRKEFRKSKYRYPWELKCDCGETKICLMDPVTRGMIKSCGKCLAINSIGKKFGKLTVVRYTGSKNHKNYVTCLCECGKEKDLAITYITRGKIVSCGCAKEISNFQKALKNIGLKHGWLKIKGVIRKNNKIFYQCRCKCRKNVIISMGDRNFIKSCGCLQPQSMGCGEMIPNSKLKNTEAETIRELSRLKIYKTKEIANIYNISKDVVRRIKRNQTYKTNSSNTLKSSQPSSQQITQEQSD